MQYLLDSSALIMATKKNCPTGLAELIEQSLDDDSAVTIPWIKFELLQGAKDQKDFNLLKKQLDSLNQDSATDLSWDDFYEFGFKLRKKGLSIPTIDLLISFIALKRDYTLLHHDKHFSLIAKHSELKELSFLS